MFLPMFIDLRPRGALLMSNGNKLAAGILADLSHHIEKDTKLLLCKRATIERCIYTFYGMSAIRTVFTVD